MRLLDIYASRTSEFSAYFPLWELLLERELHQSISHKEMPPFVEHCDFVAGRPYEAWYTIERDDGFTVGAIYLTKQREIGVGILKAQHRNGYAQGAIELLMAAHPGRFLANINPANEPSLALFRKLGFGGPIQVTLALEKA